MIQATIFLNLTCLSIKFKISFKFFEILNSFLALFYIKYIFSVPIIPDYLFSNELKVSSTDNNTDFRPASLSPLQRKFEALEDDNGPLGALLASKAFVQLAFTPLVGYLIGIVGYKILLLIGSCNMLLASVRKYPTNTLFFINDPLIFLRGLFQENKT